MEEQEEVLLRWVATPEEALEETDDDGDFIVQTMRVYDRKVS